MDLSRQDAEPLVPSRYRVHLLPRAKATERGVLYRRGEAQFLLEWQRVHRVLAAWIGPAGAPSAVFDLVLEATGPECVVARLELGPGEDAAQLARAIALGRGARDGGDAPTQRYPDLETFEAAALEAVRFRGVPS